MGRERRASDVEAAVEDANSGGDLVVVGSVDRHEDARQRPIGIIKAI